MWSCDEILDEAAGVLADRAMRFDREQAVYALDAMSEVELHPLLAGAFRAANIAVLREQVYPAEWRAKRGKKSSRDGLPGGPERRRCDIVLLPSGCDRLADPLTIERSRSRHAAEKAASLFSDVSEASAGDPETGDTASSGTAAAPEDAFWIEVKTVGQFTYTAGVPGPNPSYTPDLVRGPLSDLRKLRDDSAIAHAALLVVGFFEDARVADHDLAVLWHRAVDAQIPLRTPVVRRFEITDRIGNRVCVAAIAALAKHAPIADE